MRQIRSNPMIDELLADYACGRLTVGMHALIGAHLELKPANRQFVGGLEALAGLALEADSGFVVGNREARLDAIFASDPPTTSAVGSVLPRALQGLIGAELPDTGWKRKLPGVKAWALPGDPGVSLIRLSPGVRVPQHTHAGIEASLVLTGGYSDSQGHYLRGDLAVADGSVDHAPRADEDGECIVFAVTQGDLQLTGPIGRILQRLFGR